MSGQIDQRAVVVRRGRARLDVDEGPQALVLAEVAARLLAPGGAEGDAGDGLQPNERRLHAHLGDQPVGFEGATDGPRLAAVLVHDDLGDHAGAHEARLDEVDLRFHRGKIVLGAALEDESAA